MKKVLRYAFIGILLPTLMQYIFYFRFNTNYDDKVFNEQSFTESYNHSVYKSRQLGPKIHLWIYHKLKSVEKFRNYKSSSQYGQRFQMMYPNADQIFYLVYFMLAVIYTVLTALLLLYLFDHTSLFTGTERERNFVICIYIFVAGFTQFVITPYDNLSYFLQAAGMLLFLKYLTSGRIIYYIALAAVIVVATINRESSLLILSSIAAIFYALYSLRWMWIKRMLVLCVLFVITYLYLKISNDAVQFTEGNQLSRNLNIFDSIGLFGVLFALFTFYFIYFILNNANRILINAFLFFSLPYLLVILWAGMMIEIRLWCPILLASSVLAYINVPALRERSILSTRNV